MRRQRNLIFPLLAAALAVSPVWAESVTLGIDVLAESGFAVLQGKRVGLITNHTGLDGSGRRTVDLLAQAPGVKLKAIFATEHGFQGQIEHGETVTDEKDSKTNVPIHSLYGKTQHISPEVLKNLDVVVFDMQDVGTRFYTYATSMAYALEDCAKHKKEFVVLDRPNPVTGSRVEGEILDPKVRHFTAYFSIPVRHGLTLGELAQWHKAKAVPKAKLTVIAMRGWKRSFWWDQTGLTFVPPSPNIPTPQTALLYSGVGAFEATNVAVGRGTKYPFEIFGAPWMDGKKLAERLNDLKLPGVRFKPTTFKPTKDLYTGELCQGVRVLVKDRNRIEPVAIFTAAFVTLETLHPKEFLPRWDEVVRVTGTRFLEETLKNSCAEPGSDPSAAIRTVLERYRSNSRDFLESRKPFLLYD